MVSIDFNYDQSRMAACDARDGVVRVWQVGSDTPSGQLSSGESVRAVKAKWSTGAFGQAIATCDEDGGVRLWLESTPGKWRLAWRYTRGHGKCTDLSFAPGRLGPLLAVTHVDGCAEVLEGAAIFSDEPWILAATLECDECVEEEAGSANCVAWHPSSREAVLCVGTRSGALKIWRRLHADWILDATVVVSEDGGVCDASWSPDCKSDSYLIAAATSTRVALYGPAGKSTLLSERGASHVCWNDTGRLLAVLDDRSVCVVYKRDFRGDWIPVYNTAAPQPELSLPPVVSAGPQATPRHLSAFNAAQAPPSTPFFSSHPLQSTPSFSFGLKSTPVG